MSSDSSSVESLHLSESESDSGKVSDPPMSDSDLIEPKKKIEEEIPDTNEDDEDDEKPKRRKPRLHNATGRPRGVVKGTTKYPNRKPLAAKHIRETQDGVCAEERMLLAAKEREQRNARRAHLAQKLARIRTESLSAMDEACLERFGELPGSRMAIVPPLKVVPPKPGNLEIFNAKRLAKRDKRYKKRAVSLDEDDD